ncbi:MAG: hypothetical protein UR93_C0005G0024 [Berkelbacteria bacterium GW2011_GWA2_35_9]|uniref:DUF2079 domain-containing protein n=1 Tax=Berkelbacteria bacterium GW2011_GWA2_35_9 TaxID=1618333 RepID=A0A0G0D6P7_9BACT|nr:MAG: hypothetical protein UR93_C0005G0024 [Berkelbacteria bacterium GW2011_GWA2_35_9]
MLNKEKILGLKYWLTNLIFGYFFSLGMMALLNKGDFMDWVINNPHPKTSFQIIVFLVVLAIILGVNIIAYFNNDKKLSMNFPNWTRILKAGLLIFIYFIFRKSNLIFLLDSQFFSFSQIIGSEEIVVLILAFSCSLYLTSVINFSSIEISSKIKKIVWWLVVIIGVLIFLLISCLPLTTFNAPASDVGLFNQVFYNYSRFITPYSTIRGVTHIWADHFHPTIMLLVPFYWLFKSPITLLILQALIAVSGIIPLYLVINKLTKNYWLSLTAMLVFVLYPGLQMALSFGFYPENMAPALFLWAFWFLINNNIWKYFLFLILWIGLKESIPLHAFMLGIFIYFWGKDLRFNLNIKRYKLTAIATIIISIVWFLLATKIIIPAHAQDFYPWAKTSASNYIYANNYQDFGSSFPQIAKSILTNPLHTFYVFFHPDLKLYTLLKIIISFGGLILVPISIIAFPMFGENFLSSRFVQYNWNFHYQAQFSAILALSAILSIYYLFKRYQKPKIIIFGAVYLLSASLLTSLFLRSPFIGLKNFRLSQLVLDREIIEPLKIIPAQASVSAQNTLAPILSGRDTIYLFPRVDGAEYIVLVPQLSRYPLTDDEYQTISNGYLNGGDNYKIVIRNEKIIILRKSQ